MDQAQRLRELVALERPRARVLSVTSGKGGVGKTNISVALSLALTALNKKVALLDFDLGLANANVLLRLKHRWNLSHYIKGEKSLTDVLVKGPGGLLFLPGANGMSYLADIGQDKRRRLIKGLEALEKRVDYIIVDTGAGISKNVLTFAAHADDIILVTTPEPTSILDAYSVIRNLSGFSDCGQIQLLINQAVHRQIAADVTDRMCHAADNFLDLHIEKMGYVLTDPQVAQSVLKRRSFILENPRCPASLCLETVARQLAKKPKQNDAKPSFFSRLFGGVSQTLKLKAG